MILSGLWHALKAQNWLAVVPDFVIVITGVVIGLRMTDFRVEAEDALAAVTGEL